MSMFSTGILVLTSPLHTLPLRIAPVLSSAAEVVERTLYVHLHPGLNLGGSGPGQPPRPIYIPPVVDLSTLISRLYSNAADVCGHLDVRVLLTNVRAQPSSSNLSGLGSNNGGSSNPFPSPQSLSHSPEVVLTDYALQDPGQSTLVAQCLQRYAGHCYVCKPSLSSVLLHPRLQALDKKSEETDKDQGSKSAVKEEEVYFRLPMLTAFMHPQTISHNMVPVIHILGLFISLETKINKFALDGVKHVSIYEAWRRLFNAASAAPGLMAMETFRYDLVDITRQALQRLTTVFYQEIVHAFQTQKLPELLTSGGVLVYDLLPELDRLLSSDAHFLLGVWLESARSMGLNEREAALYDFNARNQITLWGPKGNILDYANKQWGGLVEDYYTHRWGLFVNTLVECLDRGRPFKQDTFNLEVFQVEKGFLYNERKYPTEPVGDTYEIARRIFLKYYPQAMKRLT